MKSKTANIFRTCVVIFILSGVEMAQARVDLPAKVAQIGAAISVSMAVIHMNDYLILGFAKDSASDAHDAMVLAQARRDQLYCTAAHGLGSLHVYLSIFMAWKSQTRVSLKSVFLYPALANFLAWHGEGQLHQLSEEQKSSPRIRFLMEKAWKAKAVDFLSYAVFQSLTFL